MTGQDELLTFVDDETNDISDQLGMPSWRILIADDDQDVHDSTEFALRNLTILNRSLEFLHAFSAAETIALLGKDSAIAVILLDVVMETEDAGLRIVHTIRQELGLANIRIILRTGQPGYAPEMEAISRYEINDYKTKNELTRIKLYTSLTTAVRSYDQLQRLDDSRLGLKHILDASHIFISAGGLREFAEGVIMQLAGFIGIKPEGLMCARSMAKEGEPVRYEIIGAAGHYRKLINQPLQRLGHSSVYQLIKQCLDERKSILDQHSMVLFCPGSSSDFATFVDSSHALSEIDRSLVDLFCCNIGLCGENITLISNLRESATVDPLVKLPNRLAFIEAINCKLSDDAAAEQVVALLNIDRFAEINDVLDSRYGDMMLKKIAHSLREKLPASVLIARVAGGEFGLLGEEKFIRPQLLHDLFRSPLTIDEIDTLVSFSMGLVRLRDFQSTGAELLHSASIAQKRAKASGYIGQAAYYTPEIRHEIHDSSKLLHELHLALQYKPSQFYLAYQPQIDLETGRVVGLEALVRWKKQDGTIVSPARFIPVAEQSGLIVPLGNWILQNAVDDLQQIQSAGFDDINMAVNVSAVQFRHPDFLANIDHCLGGSCIKAEQLELEITESAAILGMEFMRNMLRELKSRQILIAIDDFGTGYSSLSYLDQLPADRLKIDRSFIAMIGTDQPDIRIMEMVILLGRQLGMRVLAEGAETEIQVARLQELGCDEIQGYYFGRPMQLDDLLAWLAGQHTHIRPTT